MNIPQFNDGLLDRLFAAPALVYKAASLYEPTPNAKITSESTATLLRLLKENHKRFHVFFNDVGFQNHLSYHLFATYCLGASDKALQTVFDHHAGFQRPAYRSPEVITRENWTRHLGDHDYYNAYLNFFVTETSEHGLSSTLERFVFSREANWGPNQPRMIDRFLAGLVHPIMRFGHGTEFGVEGMAIEGLAEAAVHPTAYEKLFDEDFFSSSNTVKPTSVPSIYTRGGTARLAARTHTHALSILSRMLNDQRLAAENVGSKDSPSRAKITDTLNNAGNIIREYASLWIVDGEKDIQERIEEMTWFVTIVFGLGGWRKGREFRPSFVLMHIMISNFFVPSILPLLRPAHQASLLRAHFAVSLGWFISHGRPAFDVPGFFEQTPTFPEPGLNPNPPSDGSCSNARRSNSTHTARHQDEHHLKAQRALAYSAALYGTRPKGFFSHTELKGAEMIDGTLFMRVGGQLAGTQRWWGRGYRDVPVPGTLALPTSVPRVPSAR